MFPPQQNISLDIEALSGICGSISIACWVVVFSPQIIENFRRASADGLSVVFIIVWLAGDVFNILGAILQGVLPTMIILAVYYTLADIVLLGQVFYYQGFTISDEVKKPENNVQTGETQPLLGNGTVEHRLHPDAVERQGSSISALRKHISVDGTHLSPATPLLDAPKARDPPVKLKPTSTLQGCLFNVFAILIVVAAGVLGWYIAQRSKKHKHHAKDSASEPLEFDLWGQIFGYLCAVLYLGSRVPQLLLNYRRKSTEGVSLLFFLFACIGNLTYDMSIFAYSPVCHRPGHCGDGEAKAIYARYILVNASWIAGSLGTLVLDLAIFAQFFLYMKKDEDDEDVAVDGEIDDLAR
jgi:solute carrier family 66 (lysosomal lysine-arginine transporter), member 1